MDYTDNSHKKRARDKDEEKPEKKIEKVVTGTVVVKKPSVGSRLKTLFFGGEARGVSRYLAFDVLLPTVRNLIVDATTKGIERMVYGESVSRSRRFPPPPGLYSTSRVQYNSPFRDPRDRPRLPDQSQGRQMRAESNDVVLASREDATNVLGQLLEIIDVYEVASRADLYELIGVDSSHIDQKWGWTDLHNVQIKQVRDGFLLDLPPEEEI